MNDPQLILVAGALLAAGIGASLLAGRLRVARAGPLPGARGGDRLGRPGWIDFNDYELARTIGVIALALILFEGGLTRASSRSGRCCGPRSRWPSSARS